MCTKKRGLLTNANEMEMPRQMQRCWITLYMLGRCKIRPARPPLGPNFPRKNTHQRAIQHDMCMCARFESKGKYDEWTLNEYVWCVAFVPTNMKTMRTDEPDRMGRKRNLCRIAAAVVVVVSGCCFYGHPQCTHRQSTRSSSDVLINIKMQAHVCCSSTGSATFKFRHCECAELGGLWPERNIKLTNKINERCAQATDTQ